MARGRAAPVERTKDFSGTARRLLGRLRPEMFKLVISLLLGVVSVAFIITGPKILGNATNILFNGIVSKQLPAGVTQQQAEAMLRSHGQNQIADMISGMSLTPGAGVDLNQLGRVLGLAAAVYLLGAAFNFGQGYLLAGVTQRTMYGLRAQIEQKLTRLPLRYFDSHPHGDILSRVSNDIDNLTTTLQQGLSQLLTSVLTIVGVLGMMIWISPLLAGVALITIPLAILITVIIAKRSQVQFAAQWKRTGTLNGLVEETHTGHGLVQVFGRGPATIDEFGRQNRRLYEASFRAQFLSGIIQPTMQFLSNFNYVVIAVLGGYRVASGTMSLGDVAGLHPVLPPVHHAHHPDRRPDEHAPVRPGLRRASLRVPGRTRRERRLRPGRCPDLAAPSAGRASEPGARVLPVRARQTPHRRLHPRRGPRPDGRDRRPHRRRQDHTGQPARTLLRDRRRPHTPRRHQLRRADPRRSTSRLRHGPSGHLALCRHHRRKHRLRERGRDRRRNRRCRHSPRMSITSSEPCPTGTTPGSMRTRPTSPQDRSSC